jgi:hypothetical protein
MTLLIATCNQQIHVITVKVSALLYFLITGNTTVPMLVLYASCDYITKDGSGANQLSKQHDMMPEYIM